MIPENGAIGFYQSRPHKLNNKIVHERRRYDRIEYQVMGLWKEDDHPHTLHDPENGIGPTRVIKPREFVLGPEDAPLELGPYMDSLQDEILFKRLLAETDKRVEGEEQARHTLLNCLLAVFLKGEKNLPHTLISSVSSAGKGHVGKAVFDLLPCHMGEYMTKITPEAFTYWKAEDERWTWDGKALFLDDVSHKFLNCDTFKVMLTEGSKAVTVKDGKAIELHVPGKPVVFLTTAWSVAGDEITNRMNFVSLDESEAQTEAILRRQAEEAAGLREKEPYDWVLTNALGLLERVEVHVPYAKNLYRAFPTNQIANRRDFPRFLTLVKASAALYQQQRVRDAKGRVLAEKQDYEIARTSFQGFVFEGGVKLQHGHQKAYEYVKRLLERGVNLDDADGRAYVKMEQVQENADYSPSGWYKVLGILAKKNLLEKGTMEGDYNKPYVIYKLGKENAGIVLPSYETLDGG